MANRKRTPRRRQSNTASGRSSSEHSENREAKQSDTSDIVPEDDFLDTAESLWDSQELLREPFEESPQPKQNQRRQRQSSGRDRSSRKRDDASKQDIGQPAVTPLAATPSAETVRQEQPAGPVDSEDDAPPRKKRRRRSRKKPVAEANSTSSEPSVAPPVVPPPVEFSDETPTEPMAEKKKRRRVRKKKATPLADEPSDVGKSVGGELDDEPVGDDSAESAAPTSTTKPPRKKPGATESANGFAALGLSDVMVDALTAADYLEPTPVQAGLIPRAMEGIDLMGQAQTGTGKTAAFAIPILEQITSGKHRGPQALVLVPTRELAVQVRDEMAKLAHGRRVRIVAAYGGKPIRQQAEKISRGAEVVVGTPGRLLDHLGRGTLFVGDIRQLVLDEADRMLDIGFRPDIEKILRQCPQSRQTLLLSATLPGPVLRLAKRYMREPEELDFSPKDIAVETIEQFYFTVDPDQKFDLLVRLIEREQPRQAIVFCRTRRGTEKIYQRLKNKVDSVAAIHGDLQQRVRDRVMESFRGGRLRIMVATDVVGRGIDVSGISHIINFDIPEFCDDYVHRVGRTGRMGRSGVAYTFVSPEQGNELTRIEMRIDRLLKRDDMPGFAQAAKPEGQPEEEKPEPKPVFGRTGRRVRRAL